MNILNSTGMVAVSVSLSGEVIVHTKDLQGIHAPNLDLAHANFSKCNLTDSDFQNSLLTATNFDDCNLSNANFNRSFLKFASIRRSNLSMAQFVDADLRLVVMDHSYGDGVSFESAILEGASLACVNLYWGNLAFANFRNCIFEGAVLSTPMLSNSVWDDAVVTGMKFTRDNLGIQTLLRGADFRRLDFSGLDLSDVDTTGVLK